MWLLTFKYLSQLVATSLSIWTFCLRALYRQKRLERLFFPDTALSTSRFISPSVTEANCFPILTLILIVNKDAPWSFWNWGISLGEYHRILPSFSWGIFGHVRRLDQSCASENIWWIITQDIYWLWTRNIQFASVTMRWIMTLIRSSHYSTRRYRLRSIYTSQITFGMLMVNRGEAQHSYFYPCMLHWNLSNVEHS